MAPYWYIVFVNVICICDLFSFRWLQKKLRKVEEDNKALRSRLRTIEEDLEGPRQEGPYR